MQALPRSASVWAQGGRIFRWQRGAILFDDPAGPGRRDQVSHAVTVISAAPLRAPGASPTAAAPLVIMA